MKTKKIISNPLDVIFLGPFIGALLFVSLIVLLNVWLVPSEERGASLWAFFYCFGIALLLLWCLNRRACLVWVLDGVVYRKGLLWGFKKTLAVEEICEVKIGCYQGEGLFIYLLDESKHKFRRLRADSYISFKKTKKNLAFLEAFWHGSVKQASFLEVIG